MAIFSIDDIRQKLNSKYRLMNTIVLLTAAGIILCLPGFFKNNDSRKYLFLFILFLFINQFIVRNICIPEFMTIGTTWNWTGKIAAALFSLIAILILRRKYPIYFAFTLKQKKGSLRPVLRTVGIILIVWVIVLWLFVSKDNPSLEDHLFQLTIPGISEELAYRGLFLGLLNNVFKKKCIIFGAEIGWGAVVTSLIFGLVHVIGFNEASFYFDTKNLFMPLMVGFILAWLRQKTGSLLIPVIFHNVINELSVIIEILK